jgi:Asp-tRNA(Asn)/Glu-tRNA(Gln) amidotransferase A subunit family amidase
MAMHEQPFNGTPLHDDCRRALEDALQLCTDLGHEIDILSWNVEWAPVGDAALTIAATEVRVTLEQRAQALGRTLHEADVEPVTWRILELKKAAHAADYLRALHVLHRTGRQFARAMQGYDVVVTPTVFMPPVALGMMLSTNREGIQTRQQAIGFTQIANIAGNPAMSAPLSWNTAGLPIGIQFIGRYGDEATLFRLAGQLEQARPWFDRRPAQTRGT